MVEKIGHIKNPLTVIAIFAAIAEISGTTVLPFIEPSNQSIYVWFLMLFPTFLVGIFFLTLNLNHKVLYAPSDYKDEKNFVNPYGKATPEEQGKKLREEVEEIEAEDSNNTTSKNTEDIQPDIAQEEKEKESSESSQTNHPTRHRQLMSEVTLAEKLAVNKLSKELGVNFKTDARFEFPGSNRGAVFDAIGMSENEVHAVEVKLFKSRNIASSRLARVLEQAEIVSQYFKGIDEKEFILNVFIVIDNHHINKPELKERLYKFSMRFNVNIKIHITTLDDLQNEYQYNP